MPLSFVRGDIFLSRGRVLVFGANARGGAESDPTFTALLDRYPAALASFRKQARAGRLPPGSAWIWREALPWLALLVVRDRAGSATRPRYLEDAAQQIARDWPRENIHTLALARPGGREEWPALRGVLAEWLDASPLSVVVYEDHLPAVRAAEPWDGAAP